MKKTSAFFLVIILLSSCAPQPSSIHNTSTPQVAQATNTEKVPTTTTPLIPCPKESQTISEITIVFHEEMSDKDCNDIIKYAQLTADQFALTGYKTGQVQVNVFATPETVTDFQYDWAKQKGCNPDAKEIILQSWTTREMQAQGTQGAVFLLVNLPNDAWRNAEEVERAHAVAHEITQVVETNILGSCQMRWKIPDWYGHGVAEFLATTFTQAWGFPRQYEDLSNCKETLAEMQAGKPCIYVQAELAFKFLGEKYGGSLKTALDVLTEMAKGKSFNQAFHDTYKVSVSAFSDDFDAYRLNGYRLPTPTTAPTP